MALTQQLTAPNGLEIRLPTGLFINNEFVSGSGKPITSINPSNRQEICTVQSASVEDIDRAVEVARHAFHGPAWHGLSSSDRGALLYKLADLIDEDKVTLATLEAWDNGKPYTSALEEDLGEVIATMRYYAGWADKFHGQTMTGLGDGQKFAYTLREPVGVCGQIIPWNYPLSMAAWKLGPALATGNTVVLKPAEQTPLSILYLATLIQKAGFPPGVVNIVNGWGAVAGRAIAEHLNIDKIAFTGSTATARQIMKAASANLKNITLETGGKSPLLVFEDADLEQAAKWAHIGIMCNQGQICTATSRILVQKSIYEAFLDRFRQITVETSVVGDPFNEETFQGPQVSEAQFDRVLDYIKIGKTEGARVVTGGGQHEDLTQGYFVKPTIFADVKQDMRIYQEEIFGPVAAVVPFETEEEALQMANNSIYGLASAVFTQSIQRAHRVAAGIQSGMVWINSSQDASIHMPFGGVKQSGIGRELGEAGLDAYLQTKSVHVNLGMKI